MDYEERKWVFWERALRAYWTCCFRRKREAREPHLRSKIAKKLRGHKAKLYHKKRYSEKVQMRKMIKQHEEKQQRSTIETPSEGAIPAYLLDRQKQAAGTVLSNAIKQKRKEKAVGSLESVLYLEYISG